MLATWLISIPVYAAFPVAPPRLAHIGLIDTITSQSGFSMDSSLTTSFYNQLAAVPSLHVGFAVAIGIAVASVLRNPVAKGVALLWGPTIGLAVVATGNHFIFDIAAGVVASALGYGLGLLALRPWRPSLAPALAAARGEQRADHPRRRLRPVVVGEQALLVEAAPQHDPRREPAHRAAEEVRPHREVAQRPHDHPAQPWVGTVGADVARHEARLERQAAGRAGRVAPVALGAELADDQHAAGRTRARSAPSQSAIAASTAAGDECRCAYQPS